MLPVLPFHSNEVQRLRAVHDLRILDTPAEPRFDRLSELAAHLLGTPVGLITLVDFDRVWIKSASGFDSAQIRRAGSFCSEAIRVGAETFLVPDARRDLRFRSHPFAAGPPRLRFYAGHVLRGRNDLPVGTLCVLDTRPHRWSEQRIAVLNALGSLAQRELDGMPLDATPQATLGALVAG